ncbi:MAG TPA: PilN domain-containing protein [Candidatus Binatia bacterium]|nr:PilN domain-containing protein [Candidatus Binatia bacterium]
MATRINLLDWRAELKARRKNEFFALLVSGFLLSAGSVGAASYAVSDAIDYQNRRNQFLKDQIVETEKKIKEIEELEKVRANLIARMKVIEELQASRSAMVHFFDELLNTLPDGVYLKSVKQVGAEVTIEGVAESNGRVSNYMKNIEGSAWFAEPRLQVIKTTENNKRRQSEFTLQFKNLTKGKATGEDAG